MLQALTGHSYSEYSPLPCKEGVIDTVLQRSKLKFREIRYLGQSHREAEFNPKCVGLANVRS